MHQQNQNNLHIPVLLTQTLKFLLPRAGESYLDLTGGYGGHAAAVLEQTNNPEGAVLVDRDSNAIAELKKRFAGQDRNPARRLLFRQPAAAT
jgi:16S rRNA (cytosine1402-N4)-methyltransferase